MMSSREDDEGTEQRAVARTGRQQQGVGVKKAGGAAGQAVRPSWSTPPGPLRCTAKFKGDVRRWHGWLEGSRALVPGDGGTRARGCGAWLRGLVQAWALA